MLFNSFNFAIFLPIIFLLYWFVIQDNLRWQNFLLLVASYFFYACWDWRFLFLLIFSTLLDYLLGIKIHECGDSKKRLFWLWLSIGINFGILWVFKYYNFFAQSFANLLSGFGVQINFETLHVILPIGISFYTLHGLSYVIDLYKKRIIPESNIINYSVFVSFFPLLIAGPIERATHLLPQLLKKRNFDYSKAVDGMRQILWGLFKKIAIADNCAEYVNNAFNNSANYSGSTLVLAAILFAFQIYCDFSGYSDIAIGTARLFGIDLLRNFAFPFFSRDIAEFWRRWHISLSSWFRDYLYIPLGGRTGGIWIKVRNIFIIFIISGLWHGANWTYISWGALNALFFLPLLLLNKKRKNLKIVAFGKSFPTIREFFAMLITFSLIVFSMIFFRASNIADAINYISGIFSNSLFSIPKMGMGIRGKITIALIIIIVVVEWIAREHQYAIANLGERFSKPVRWSIYYLILLLIFLQMGQPQQFFYFQF